MRVGGLRHSPVAVPHGSNIFTLSVRVSPHHSGFTLCVYIGFFGHSVLRIYGMVLRSIKHRLTCVVLGFIPVHRYVWFSTFGSLAVTYDALLF